MKNIILAFDGSEYSNRALQYAKTFAERFEATLWLVHIFTHTSDLLGYEDYKKPCLAPSDLRRKNQFAKPEAAACPIVKKRLSSVT